MKAILVHQFGGPEVLKLEEVPTPKPAAGQVLVRIHAAGVNPYDTYMRAGTYAVKPPLPYTPGSDAAGVIEAVGDGVKKVKPGDRVYTAKTVTGAYAEYALALEEQVHSLPEKISFGQGAGVWVPYGTAYHALYQSAEACASESVLVHGASGKVGYQEEIMKATGGRGVDIILEMLANVNLSADLKLLATNGRVIIIGNRGEITINPRDLMLRRATARGFTLWAITPAEEAQIHAGLIAGLENGTLRPVVGKELPLAEATRAHKEILEPGASGKMVLLP